MFRKALFILISAPLLSICFNIDHPTTLFLYAELPKSPNKHVNDEVWSGVKDYLLPNDHPIKKRLDKIFSSSRALRDMKSMKKAGFESADPQHHTQIIVTKHPAIKGYIIKTYLDEQPYHSYQPEYYFWVKRIIGARILEKSIRKHKFQHLLKVPKKWLYLLPEEPSPPSDYLRKNFILVEEDMDIYNDRKNEMMWGSPAVTKELLEALYIIITEGGFFDCSKPANCPFSKDGKVAFVDTQTYNKKNIRFHKLTPFLSPQMSLYWRHLIRNGPGRR